MRDRFHLIEERVFYALLAVAGLVVVAGLLAAHFMEEHGHAVTGMDNQIVWGLPHVFAIFLIVAASGVLNVASVGSVFDQPAYKVRAPLSGVLCIAMLAGGLMVLMLDLGRPERIVVAATHYNPTSVFAWNVVLYSGMVALVALYLWTMFEKHLNRWSRPAGVAVLVWRFVLTTGTGSIFGFLVARQAYQSALLAPMFIVMSFGWGLAVFLLVQASMMAWNRQTLPPGVQRRLNRLLGVFVAASLYLAAVFHATNLYYARQHDFEAFILRDGGVYPWLLWAGFVGVGSLLPMALLFQPRLATPRMTLPAAAAVVAGAFCFLYVFIVGGQAFPLEIFPGHIVSSAFADGQVAHYTPRWPEWLLGLGGVAAAFVLTSIGVRVLDVLPRDANLEP